MPVRTTNAKAEAKYNVTTEFPSLGLHAAAATGNMGLVEYALARGQPVNSVLDGVLPLHAACAGGSEPVVKLLIDHGADVNGPRLPRRYSNEKNTVIIGTSGSTPLHFAAANGNMNIVKLLLRRGAIADRPDKHGITPEMVARQNGFVECADFLHSWICNKDKDLRERDFRTGRDTQSPERADTPDPYGDAASGSRRLKVKRSIDTALSMLKASSSGLSEQYQKAANSSGHSIAERRADTMPRKLSDAGPQSPILENGPPPGFDPNYRRPSLPQLEHPRLASPARSSHRTSHYSSRRPRSAGTDAEQEAEQAVYIPYGRGGAGRKLGNKYSIRNFLNKRRDGSVTPSFADPFSSQQAAASSGASSSILDSNSHTPISSSPPHHVHSASDTLALPASYASTLTAMDSQSSQLSNNTPSAVDLHNALAQQQRNRDRSASGASRTRFELPAQDDTERQPSGGASRSPLKPDSNTAQARARSPSGASSTPNRSGAVFDDDVVIPRETPVKRPGILRPHNRTSSGGQSGSSIRALRFDSSSSISERTSSYNSNNSSTSRFGLRGCNSAGSLKHGSKAQAGKRPGSAGNPISRISSEASADVSSAVEDEEDDSYGEIIHKQPSFEKEEVEDPRRARGFSVNSTDSQISPGVLLSGPEHAETTAEFPFSISRPPPVSAGSDSATSSPNLLRVPLPASNAARGRGDSLSSVSSAGSREPSLIMSTTSHSDGSATTPTIDVFTSHPSDTSLAHNIANLNERRSHTPLGIDLSAISSHAQAEALVQKAQQDILAADTDIPLSARLAAYGESLALERRLREEKEKKKEGRGSVLIAHGPMSGTSSPSLTPSMLPSTPMPGSARSWIEEADKHTSPTLTRQSSTGKAERRRHRKNMVKVPRRPHTSTGATGHSIMPDIAVNGRRLRTVSDDPRLHHTCHSTSSLEGLEAPTSPVQEEDAPASPAAGVPQTPVTPVATQLSHVSSLDVNDTDTDGELGESRLYRVSTAPHASPGGRSGKGVDNEARKASAQKLARMGFAPHDRTPQNTKRFGGLKSWVQSFKGKPV